MSDDEPITVLATIAQATGALKTMADGGFRIIFDVPESELASYIRLHLLRECRLKLTIEIDDDGTTKDRDRYFQS